MTTTQDESLLIHTLGNSPKLRVIDFLLDNDLFDFSKTELIDGAGLSKTTFFKIWDEIEGNGIVRVSRRFGNTKLYALNRENPIVLELRRLERILIERAASEASKEVAIVPAETNISLEDEDDQFTLTKQPHGMPPMQTPASTE